MSKQLFQTSILNNLLLPVNWSEYSVPVSIIHNYLEGENDEPIGWINAPLEENEELVNSILQTADEIKAEANVLIVVGVGGSFLGAKAIQDALSPYFGPSKMGLDVIYVGYNMSGSFINQLIDSLDGKDIYVNVISKSGSTMESALAFRIIRKFMEDKYGDQATKRIIVTTDAEKGLLKKIANNVGYRQFIIPKNIGGRYSVLTPVGLLPAAVAGIDIIRLLEGAKNAAILLKDENIEQNEAYQYAVIRNELYKQGYRMELLATFEPSLKMLSEWWKQLFAESEGKNKKGLYPCSVSYSTDLHSIGQFIQEGNPILFETFLHFRKLKEDCYLPFDRKDDDKLNYLSNRSINQINSISKDGIVAAHFEAGVPIIQLELEALDAYHIGFLMYFFMKACAMSAYLLEVNPFNQPGVEAYKIKILELLKGEEVFG